MSNEIKPVTDVNEIWTGKGVEVVRKAMFPQLTSQQFMLLHGLGKSLGANPYNREIWAVTYKDQTSIFLARDFYRRKAQEQADYRGHNIEAFYSNDKITMKNGEVNHEINMIDRGNLLGAYAVGYREGMKTTFHVSVLFSEYSGFSPTWKAKPETMIKKVAECQLLRMMYQGVFAGTYGEGEDNWIKKDSEPQSDYKNLEPPKINTPDEEEIQSTAEEIDAEVVIEEETESKGLFDDLAEKMKDD